MEIKKIIGKTLRAILPWRIYKLVANGGIIVPKYYKDIINDAEKYRDYSLTDSDEKTLLLMRKHAHIIDKGLQRADVEPGHSKECYNELISEIDHLKKTKYKDDPTLCWAMDKAEQYTALQSDSKSFSPSHEIIKESEVTYSQIIELIKQRRSNRVFKKETISQEIIENLIHIANWAPSSCNKQPIRIFYTNDPHKATKCLTACKGGTGFGEFIPSFWAFTADTRGYVWPSELYLPAIDTSLGIQNILLTAHTLGISGTLLTWAQKSNSEEIFLRKTLQIPKEYTIICCAVLGYAQFNYCTPIRKTT